MLILLSRIQHGSQADVDHVLTRSPDNIKVRGHYSALQNSMDLWFTAPLLKTNGTRHI